MENHAFTDQYKGFIHDQLWVESMLHQFDEILRAHYEKDTPIFADVVITHVCKIIEIAIGGVFFIIDKEKQKINAIAGFGCTLESMTQTSFDFGEGIIGQVVKSKKTRYIEHLPKKSVVVSSGLGTIGIASLFCMPLIFNEEVYGIIEIACLKSLTSQQKDFLERLSKNIASTLQSVQNNMQLRQLLLQLQQESSIRMIRERELNKSMEELKANQEELKANQEELRAQKEQLESAFEALHKQNTKVNDSIRYAQRIQNAILPHESVLYSGFAEHFVIFKPKDVVSGDFYWYLETMNKEQLPMINDELPMTDGKQPRTMSYKSETSFKKKFLAVVDCTGHGVPGAFMSMIGNTLLYEIIATKHIYEPHLILEQLHLGILNSLNKKDANMQDGMDIALCCIEKEADGNIQIFFSGAKRPLYYFSKQKLHEIKANRRSIGHFSQTEEAFKIQKITLTQGDILYMTTDGWIDAISPERNRFGSQRFKDMLVKGANLPLEVQKQIFLQILEDHEQGTEQRDDVLMVGVRV